MEYVTIKECPALEPYSFGNQCPVIHLKTSDVTCTLGANSEKEFKDIINIMPKSTKAFILYNLEAYLVLKYFSDAYLVTKIIDI
jgi:hypothetical protein